MRNLKNILIAILAPLPSLALYLTFLRFFGNSSDGQQHGLFRWCFRHPFFLANLLFFINVDLIFWLISLLQSSHWLIDLYWTGVPVMLIHFYATHPLSKLNMIRSRIVILLTWVWGIRLSHNYLRREKWELGAREDWRFTNMRKQYGKGWWWISFFAVYVSQQIFLIGNCLPMYAVHSSEMPLNVWDTIAAIVCLSGIVVAYIADTQLFNFMQLNNKLKEIGAPSVPVLDKGLWRYSRRPNYFGEQLWWWGLAIFGWNVGQPWTSLGALVNSICLAYVTRIVEQRMLKQEDRAEAYRRYQKTTSTWLPWFKLSPKETKDKSN